MQWSTILPVACGVAICWWVGRALLAAPPRVKQGVALLAICALAAIMFWTDWPHARLAQFWAEHAIVSGTVTSILLLGAGLLAVDARAERLRGERTDQVMRLALQELDAPATELLAVARAAAEHDDTDGTPLSLSTEDVMRFEGARARMLESVVAWMPVLSGLADGRGADPLAASALLRSALREVAPPQIPRDAPDHDRAWVRWQVDAARLAVAYGLWAFGLGVPVDDEPSYGGEADARLWGLGTPHGRPLDGAAHLHRLRMANMRDNARRHSRPSPGRWLRLGRPVARHDTAILRAPHLQHVDLCRVVDGAVRHVRGSWGHGAVTWSRPDETVLVLADEAELRREVVFCGVLHADEGLSTEISVTRQDGGAVLRLSGRQPLRVLDGIDASHPGVRTSRSGPHDEVQWIEQWFPTAGARVGADA
ncbi:hypothetical protein H9657_10220 [Cellulomonas sp. Sa3CUA2]|uniref:Uncharacterized protein n=1 Tax=Cellulomonas avistercoris TaxID=2762242 RepID=A0ABR8QDY0_9CELL|nr:hypothetical protein [Cellulomonas avistercoris]MBD7918647.1 hypothetical protein [Cellulomonas avistercoris]